MELNVLFFFQIIDPLPPVDHTEIEYDPFIKNFYEEHDEIRQLSPQQVNDLRDKLGIRVSWNILQVYFIRDSKV